MTKFKPLLAPNDQPNLEDIKFPVLASDKLDGIRCILYKGEILSRSLKPIQNKQLREKLRPLADYSRDNDLIIDGEIYSPKLSFQEITKYVMTKDFTDPKTIKKEGRVLEIPEHLMFYGFDCIVSDNFEEKFFDRVVRLANLEMEFHTIFKRLMNVTCNTLEELHDVFESVIEDGGEGLILRSYEGRYKCGRGTLKEGIIYKLKPYATFDAKIMDVVQATEVNPNAEKKINELGNSVTSKKKGDRILVDKASAVWVEYEEKPLKVMLAMTDEEKKEIWANKDNYVGRFIEYKGMLVGAKDVPRHPVFIRFREDKDEL